MTHTASFLKLKSYCEKEGFKGWDPYDGLNSKVFQALPLKHWDLARLAWIQGFKRSPVNFRRLLLVPKQHNAKGVALFLNGYCRLYRIAKAGNTDFGTPEELLDRINELATLLLELKQEGYSGACWGYNFDWQARRLFLFPKNTPTVVATSFCVDALLEAFDITGNELYRDVAITAADFVLNDLNRTPFNSGFLFSYSPLKGNNTVINASLLGAQLLSQIYAITGREELKATARTTIQACCEQQADDGSWVYGMLPVQSWIDSFHTGYNLMAIQSYQQNTGDQTFATHLQKGTDFYLNRFFEHDGTPKYYHNAVFPIDIHCPGQLFVTLSKLGIFQENKLLALAVENWTVRNMQHHKGYFYYQMKKGINSKIPYMRWSNAFMFNAWTHIIWNTIVKYE